MKVCINIIFKTHKLQNFFMEGYTHFTCENWLKRLLLPVIDQIYQFLSSIDPYGRYADKVVQVCLIRIFLPTCALLGVHILSDLM